MISPTEYIIGMPITIVNTKYERHKVEFNLALVIEKEEYKNIRVYENIVRKMAMYLSLLEDINEQVSDLEKKKILENVTKDIYTNLRKTGECYVEVSMNEIIVLSVKKACKYVQTYEIESSSVPVLRVDREDLNIHAISQNFVIPFIDGRNCVAKIAFLAKSDEEIVKIALNYLL